MKLNVWTKFASKKYRLQMTRRAWQRSTLTKIKEKSKFVFLKSYPYKYRSNIIYVSNASFLQIFHLIALVIPDMCHLFFTISSSVRIWSQYWVIDFTCIGLSILIFKSTDTLSGAIPLDIWACTYSSYYICEFYHVKMIYMIWLIVKLSGWK